MMTNRQGWPLPELGASQAAIRYDLFDKLQGDFPFLKVPNGSSFIQQLGKINHCNLLTYSEQDQSPLSSSEKLLRRYPFENQSMGLGSKSYG